MAKHKPVVPPQTLPRPRFNDGEFVVRRTGLRSMPWVDLYHWLMRARWSMVMALGFSVYMAINLGFAGLLMLQPGAVNGAEGYWDLLSFSVQTFATIGYGALTPATDWADLLVLLESFVAVAFTALGTGIMFAKFSRPSARITFSNVMVVHERNGTPSLVFRMANERKNQVVEARLHASLLRDEVSEEGDHLRRFVPLPLERSFSPMFTLGWTAIHPIDEHSPLYGLNEDNLNDMVIGVVVIFTGTDDTFAQPVHSRHNYAAEDIRIGYRFIDMLNIQEWGLNVRHDMLDEIVEV